MFLAEERGRMRKRKHFIICVIWMGVISSAFLGCVKNSDRQQAKMIKIGVTVYDQYDTFLSQLMECFNDYAGKKEEETGITINVEVYNASQSQSTQNNQVETMLGDGCDVICVNLVDRTDPTTIIDQAKKADIPVIFFNRELVDEDLERWNKLYYVGAKALESGIMEGELAVDAFNNNKAVDKNGDGIFQYVILEGEPGHQDAIVRTEYSVKSIVEAGVEVEKLGYGIANWNRAQAQTKMSQMINQYGDKIELLLANNDDMALGAIDALKAAKIKTEKWPVILGIDGTDVGLEAVKKREMTATVYNDKEGQANIMLNLAYSICTGGDINKLHLDENKYIRLPYFKVTYDSVEEFINRK
jgi:ABC-type sugar transport system, periplasmic component